MLRIAALTAVLAAAFALFYATARTPSPAPASAPATQFSAGRAMADIAVMGAVAHPVGSPANAAVRDYLVRRMTELGLSPRVQNDEAVRAGASGGERWVSGAHVDNVIGVLPGRNPALPALALMAHHDSVPGSPGAADDTTSVADALEIVRAIKASGQPLRDVMLVITDGEEAGLLGATAFFADDPAARHVGFVINLETRGGGGRAQLFETGPGNGAAIDLFRRTARMASANSLSVFVYKELPNDTDYTVAKAAGVPGFNFAFIGRQFDYHSPSSTVAALDQGSVQQMGEEVLGPARALAMAPALPPRSADAVYGNLVGDFILAYPPWVGWIVLAVVAGLIGLAGARARRAGELKWRDLAQGFGASFLLVAAAALGLHLVRHLTGIGFGWIEGRALLARFPQYEVATALAGLAAVLLTPFALAVGEARFSAILVAVAAALAASAFGGPDTTALIEGGVVVVLGLILLGRPPGLTGAWIGALISAFVLALGLQILAPTTAFVVAWPLAAGAVVANLVAPTQRVLAQIRWVCALALMVLVAAWAGGLIHGLLQAMDVPELPALPFWLASLALWPLLWPWSGARGAAAGLGAVALVGALGIALWLHFTSPWSPRHPAVAEPLYVVDEGSGHAWRVSPFEPDRWTRGVLSADGGTIDLVRFPTFAKPAWAAAAMPRAVLAPAIAVTKAADGTIDVRARFDPTSTLRLDLRADTVVTDGATQGKPTPILTRPGQWTHFVWRASRELSISFRPVGHGALDIRYADFTPQWPAGAKPLPPMPADLMAWDMAGSSVATGASRSTW
ncbi:MAG: M20/M25/M40 family metallo-hydrolase [Caulobacteraceae bacterium]